MEEIENKTKGGVIIIGSLFWEDKGNAIQEKESIDLAEKRKEWRENYLNLEQRKIHKLPIRYGRCSSKRKCTYTMVFSRDVLGKESCGLVIPYKDEIDFSTYDNFEKQAKELSLVEGISKDSEERLRRQLGCIGIYISSNPNKSPIIKNYWDRLRQTDSEYGNKTPQYYNPDNDPPLIDSDYCLIDVQIDTEIDFLFFCYMRVEHQELNDVGKPIRKYPSLQEIAGQINRSGYKTYFQENKDSGIVTFQDINITPLVK